MSEHIKQNRIVSLDSLAPHPRNYRVHPQHQIDKLVLSLQRFGQGRSIVIQDSPEHPIIVAGHGIVEAAQALKWQELRADILPADWTSEQVEGYLIADNEHSKEANDNDELLALLLQEQQDAGFDLRTIGTDDETLRQMLEAMGDGYLAGGGYSEGAGGDDYEVDTDDIEIRCKRGELWQLGKHRLLVDDCTKAENIKRLMQGEKAVCCWTDPPYGVSYVGKTKDALTIQNDGKEDIDAFLQRAFAALDTALDDGAAIYIAHPAGALCITFGHRFLLQGWRLHETLIWVKDSMVLGHSDYHYRHEPILFGYKAGEGRQGRGGEGWYGDNSQTTVFEVARPKRSEEHPTMKPVELIEIMLQNSSPKNGLIYEPFAGSGSTLIAAERLKRRCYAMELDEKYATVILNRWEAETGQTAQLLTEEVYAR